MGYPISGSAGRDVEHVDFKSFRANWATQPNLLNSYQDRYSTRKVPQALSFWDFEKSCAYLKCHMSRVLPGKGRVPVLHVACLSISSISMSEMDGFHPWRFVFGNTSSVCSVSTFLLNCWLVVQIQNTCLVSVSLLEFGNRIVRYWCLMVNIVWLPTSDVMAVQYSYIVSLSKNL
jgi:hypothetical protein